MRNERGVTLITMIVMIVVITIIATISITGGIGILKESKKQVLENNLASVKSLVNNESAKFNTAGILTPANATTYGIEDAKLEGIRYTAEGVEEQVIKNIGTDWFFVDKDALEEMGIEYVDENYVINYRLNIVIPMSSTENIHEIIADYEAMY